MLISNRFVRTYLFVSKAAIIHNKSFQCHVSTAKEGLFQKLSTIIFEPRIGNTVGAGAAGFRPCGKVIYSPTLRKNDRLQLHDVIAKTLDAFGEEGCTLEEALEQIFADLKRRGIAVETINLAADQGQADAQFNSRGPRINSEGVTQGDTQMAVWFRKNAEQGGADAQFNLGYFVRQWPACPRTTHDAAFWFARRLNKATPRRNITLGFCTTKAKACPRTTRKQRFGIARRLNRASPWHKIILGFYTTRAGCASGLHASGSVVSQGGRAGRLRPSCALVSQGG